MVATWQAKRKTALFSREELDDAVAGIGSIVVAGRDGGLDVAAGTDLVRHVRTLAIGASFLGGRPDDGLLGQLGEAEALLTNPGLAGIDNVARARTLLRKLRGGQRITEAEARFNLAASRGPVTRPPRDITVALGSAATVLEAIAVFAAIIGVVIGIWVATRPHTPADLNETIHPYVWAGIGIAVLSIILGAFFWVLTRAGRVIADMAQRGG